jgi:hypothetical protein
MFAVLRNQLIRVAFDVRSDLIRLRRTLRLLGQARIGALDHITIPVRDLAIARTFYCDVLGAAYSMTVDDETFRRFGRPTAPSAAARARTTCRSTLEASRASISFCSAPVSRRSRAAIRTSHSEFHLGIC